MNIFNQFLVLTLLFWSMFNVQAQEVPKGELGFNLLTTNVFLDDEGLRSELVPITVLAGLAYKYHSDSITWCLYLGREKASFDIENFSSRGVHKRALSSTGLVRFGVEKNVNFNNWSLNPFLDLHYAKRITSIENKEGASVVKISRYRDSNIGLVSGLNITHQVTRIFSIQLETCVLFQKIYQKEESLVFGADLSSAVEREFYTVNFYPISILSLNLRID